MVVFERTITSTNGFEKEHLHPQLLTLKPSPSCMSQLVEHTGNQFEDEATGPCIIQA